MPNPSKANKTSKRVTTKKAPTPADQWKGKADKKPHPLDLPSGNTCLVKRVGLESFLKGGVIPNSLLGVIEESMNDARKGKSMTQADETSMMKEIQEDPQKMSDMFDLVDLVTLEVVVEPGVHPVPENEEDRDEDLLYIDQVDMGDKMHIFNYTVGGTADYARFREETSERVAALDLVQGTEVPTE